LELIIRFTMQVMKHLVFVFENYICWWTFNYKLTFTFDESITTLNCCSIRPINHTSDLFTTHIHALDRGLLLSFINASKTCLD